MHEATPTPKQEQERGPVGGRAGRGEPRAFRCTRQREGRTAVTGWELVGRGRYRRRRHGNGGSPVHEDRKVALPSLNRDGDGEDASTGRGPRHGHGTKARSVESMAIGRSVKNSKARFLHSVFMDSTNGKLFYTVINGKT